MPRAYAISSGTGLIARKAGQIRVWQDRIVVRAVTPPLHPKHPERVCWGCDKYCPAAELACGNGTIRTPHPVELFGDDWLEWAGDRERPTPPTTR